MTSTGKNKLLFRRIHREVWTDNKKRILQIKAEKTREIVMKLKDRYDFELLDMDLENLRDYGTFSVKCDISLLPDILNSFLDETDGWCEVVGNEWIYIEKTTTGTKEKLESFEETDMER